MKKILILFVAISISMLSLYSQTKTIKGRVISDDLETVPGVFIMINDTVDVGITDLNGFFQIEIPIFIKKISFGTVGLEPATIELIDTCDRVEIVMMLSGTDDFISLRRAERIRKRRFKQLTKIHKQAYEKGLFQTEQPCYKREFEYLYLHKKKRI